MSAPVRCAATCSVSNAEFRTSKAGTQYLSLTAHRLGEDEDGETLWITVWSRSKSQDLIDRLKPNCALYVEGTVWIKRWERGGIAQSALSINADVAEVLYDIEARPKAKKKETERPLQSAAAGSAMRPATGRSAGGGSEQTMGQSEHPFDDAKAAEGEAVNASALNSKPADAPSDVRASHCAGPAPKQRGVTYERPFDDEIPF